MAARNSLIFMGVSTVATELVPPLTGVIIERNWVMWRRDTGAS